MENVIEKLMKHYNQHYEDFTNDLESLEQLRGYDVHLYKMDELDKLFGGKSPSDIIMTVFFGNDEHEATFNPRRKYFTFNGCGGLASTDDDHYNSDCLNPHTVGDIIENAERLSLSDGAKAIIAGQD